MQRKSLVIVVTLALVMPIFGGAASAQDSSPAASPAAAAPDPSISGDISVGMVGNPQMIALQELVAAGEFNRAYPNINVNLTVLPENQIRQTITQDITGQSGQFDVVTIGPFEVPLWAEQGWLEEVGEEAAADPTYALDDVFPSMRDGLTFEEGVYALPFYGESAMTYYRKDLFEAAGIQMPERPTWTQVAEFAAAAHAPDQNPPVYGLCLRGLPGWGEQGAPLTTIINAFGGRWFDEEWNAALSEEDSAAAIRFYIESMQQYGPPGVEQNGFTETETLFAQGSCAQWYDATSAAELLTSPDESPEFYDQVGFAYGPAEKLPHGNWLWSWNFAMAANSDAKDASLAFMKWATSRTYQQTIVAADGGWGRAPTGARASTYEDPAYLEVAGDFADIVLNSINESNPNEPCEEPVPYTGGQFVRIPEFQALGDDVTQQFASALVGDQTVDEAIQAANDLANQTAIDGGYQ
ncbi:MAG: sugar ABC transporter substrate-binding protein [Chloroflexia bacterium]|nr:sugar ABC transporter substrate-binding protein [Chloroflexia bacterium]MBA3642641.1 sugar ABC transporter substrate-binding protein [Chloroflexia bacterium]